MTANHRCKVHLIGRHCVHELCITIGHGVPQELRCTSSQPDGYGPGGGSQCGCHVPEGIAHAVERELRDDLQECRRRGYVLIRAA